MTNKANKFQRLVLAALTITSASTLADDAPTSKHKGEFILSRNQFQNPVCQRFTRNLNQFRHLDFLDCHPRLSQKFPEFSRPTWEEFPFDLGIAEKVVKAKHGGVVGYPNNAEILEQGWQRWREASKAVREAGKARMWRTQIDFDADGKADTLIRMWPATGTTGAYDTAEQSPYSCESNLGTLHMADGAIPYVAHDFNNGFGSDIIHFKNDNRYYRVQWDETGPAYPQIHIGATRGVIVSSLRWVNSHAEGGHECRIDWVPTGHYKPLKRKH